MMILVLVLVNFMSNNVVAPSMSEWSSLFYEDPITISATNSSDGDIGYRLSQDLEPLHYVVEITPYFENEDEKEASTFDGIVTIVVKATRERIDQLTIHENVVQILEVKVKDANGQSVKLNPKLPFKRIPEYNFLIINLADEEVLVYQAFYNITVNYTAAMSEDPRSKGLFSGRYQDEKGNIFWYASSHFHPIYARKAFPCFDDPGFKSTFNLIVNRPASFGPTYSNMKVAKEIKSGNRIKEIFHITPRMCAYLLSIHISKNFKVIAKKNYTTSSFNVIARPSAKGQGGYASKIGPKIIQILINYLRIDSFTIAENFNENHIAVPDILAFGTEDWGSAHYREEYLLYTNKENNVAVKENIAQIMSQIIIHKWFGNLVTCQWWDNTWINIGFPAYLQYVVLDAVDKTLEMNDKQSFETKHALFFDSDVSTTAMQHIVISPSDVQKSFNEGAYQKSCAFLLMLKHFVGENTFKNALTYFLVDNAFENALPQDVYSAFTNAVPKQSFFNNIKKFMRTWIEQPGYPVINVEIEPATGLITLRQERFLTDEIGQAKNQVWSIPLSFTTGMKPDWQNLTPSYLMTESYMEIKGTSSEHWVIFNLQRKGLYRVNYDIHNWQKIIDSLKKKPNEFHHLNRAQIVDDIFAFMMAKKMSFEFGFQVLDFLKGETNYYVWNSAISSLKLLRNKFFHLSDELEKFDHIIHAYLEAVINNVGYDVKDGEPHVKIKNRRDILKFACDIGHEGCIYDAVAKFKALRNAGAPVDPNLRDHVYCRGVHEGSYEDWNFLKQLWETSNSAAAKSEMLYNLGCTTNERALQEYLEIVIKLTGSPSRLLHPIHVDHRNAIKVLQFVKERTDFIRTTIGDTLEFFLKELASQLREEELQNMERWIVENQATLLSEEYKAGMKGIDVAREKLGRGWPDAEIITGAAKNAGIAVVSTLFRTFVTNGVNLLSRLYNGLPQS